MIRRRPTERATAARGGQSLLSLSLDPDKLKKFGLKKRQIGAAARESLTVMAAAWHAAYLPEHFKLSAYERYGYYQRKGMGLAGSQRAFNRSYVGRKMRYAGHNRPLVFSGEGEREARVLRMRVSTTQARVILPSKFNFKHPKSRISMRDEITRVLPQEAADLVGRGRRAFRAAIAKPPQGA